VAAAPPPVGFRRRAVSSVPPIDRDRITAIVPCCDSPCIESVLRELRDAVGPVLVVADVVSPDEQRRIDALAATPGVDVLRLERSRGKGHALAAGFEHLARAGQLRDAVLVLDADGQHPPQRVGDFARALADADVAVGDRSGDRTRMPAVRQLSNAATNALLSLVLRRRVPDSQCGMRLFRTEALVRVPLPRGGFEAETRHLKELVAAGLRVAWVPIPAIYGGRRARSAPGVTAGGSWWPRSPRSAPPGPAEVSARAACLLADACRDRSGRRGESRIAHERRSGVCQPWTRSAAGAAAR
jgi:hypothetical protein